MKKLWTKDRELKLSSVNSFDELADLALEVLHDMNQEGKPIVEICGPISTGGLGSIEKNMAHFTKAITGAQKNNLNVFDLEPFEKAIVRLKDIYPKTDGYCLPILDIFYRRIFESGFIKQAYFLPDWQSSKGARWERETLASLKIPIYEYPTDWLNQ